jgi:carbon storage regulator
VLILSRKIGEQIWVDKNICIEIVDIRGGKVRIGVTAPDDVTIHRKEVLDRIEKEKVHA